MGLQCFNVSTSETLYRGVAVSGDIFIRDQLKHLVKVGSVDFQEDNCHGNPIVAYIKRHGRPQGSLTALPNGGYSLINTNGTTLFNSPQVLTFRP